MSHTSNSESSAAASDDGISQNGAEQTTKRGVELASKVLIADKKRFYLDVKENDIGRYLQITALMTGGRKSRVFMTLSIAKQLAGLLEKAEDVKESDYPKALGRLMSRQRVFFADLRKNEFGSFIRLTQTFNRAPKRFSVHIPAAGIAELRQKLLEIVEEFGGEEEADKELPPSAHLRDVRNKLIYFDSCSNSFGDYLRITETRFSSDNRTSITVSFKNLERFHEILGETIKSFKSLRASNDETSNGATTADEATSSQTPAAAVKTEDQ